MSHYIYTYKIYAFKFLHCIDSATFFCTIFVEPETFVKPEAQ